jgi:protein TonB
MPRSAISILVVLSLLGLAACSKKQEPTPPPATDTTASADTSVPPPREFDFSGKSTNTGPTSPASSVKPGQPEATPPGMVEVQMPVMVEYYPPFYPIADRMKGAEGRLLVGVVVTETGAVEAAEVISSTMPAYAAEVIKATAQWRFIPAMAEGKPVRFAVKIPVNFISEFGSGGMPPGSPLENLVLSGDTYYRIGADGKYTLANLDVTPLTRVDPVFAMPENVKEARVTLKFRVDEQGRVHDPEITESSKTGFDEAALKAIRYWQFLPKIKNGKPVSASAKLPLRVSR